MEKMDKVTQGFLIGLNEKNWKHLKAPGISPQEYLILFNLAKKFNVEVSPQTLKRFTAKQQRYFKQNGKTTGYVWAYQILEDAKKAGTIGKLFDMWGLEEIEKGSAAGMIAAVNQQLQNISAVQGLAAEALIINRAFGSAGKGLAASPVPWMKVAGLGIMALSTILPVLIKDNSPAKSVEEMTGTVKRDLPPLPDRTTAEGEEKYGNKPTQEPKPPKKSITEKLKPLAGPAKLGVAAGAGKGIYDLFKSPFVKWGLLAVGAYMLMKDK